MSELMTAIQEKHQFRWQLLTTVSILALGVVVNGAPAAAREDDCDRPTIWLEIGGQLDRNSGTGQPFVEPFMLFKPAPTPFATGSPIDVQRAPRYSKGGDISLAFDPTGSDWSFSASLRYGRSNGNKHVFIQTDPHRSKYYGPGQFKPIVGPYAAPQFAETSVRQSGSHAILDFQAGKDVGLGVFGFDSTSTIAFGVRFAQFSSRADVKVRTRQNIHISNLLPDPEYLPKYKFHTYYLRANSERSFHGIGPSLSWKANTPVFGNPREGELAVDWGVTGAIYLAVKKRNCTINPPTVTSRV